MLTSVVQKNPCKPSFKTKIFGSNVSPISFITFVIGHKEAIGTLGYPIASKLGDYVAGHHSVHRQTHTGLYNIDVSRILVVKAATFN